MYEQEFTIIERKAPCPYYEKCGGCSLQHIKNYSEYKNHLIKNSLKELDFRGKLFDLYIIKENSRRRVSFKVKNYKLGFNQSKTNNVINISSCLLLDKDIDNLINPINIILKKIRKNIDRVSLTKSDTGVELQFFSKEKADLDIDLLLTEFANQYNLARVVWNVNRVVLQRRDVQLNIADCKVSLPINSFLQVSKESSEIMAQIICENLESQGKILELYCGVGSFTFFIAKKAPLLAMEGNIEAVNSLQTAIKTSGLCIDTLVQDLYLNPIKSNKISEFSQVVINPPRNGSSPQIREIAESSASRVILVSCSLESFVRDSKLLLKNNFILDKIYPIDQFLYSKHLEIIAVFTRTC